MRGNNVNRLVWNNNFTNDKRHSANHEPYKKTCNKCYEPLVMTPKAGGFTAMDLNGSKHQCKGKPAKSRLKAALIKTNKTKSVTEKGKAQDWLVANGFDKADYL